MFSFASGSSNALSDVTHRVANQQHVAKRTAKRPLSQSSSQGDVLVLSQDSAMPSKDNNCISVNIDEEMLPCDEHFQHEGVLCSTFVEEVVRNLMAREKNVMKNKYTGATIYIVSCYECFQATHTDGFRLRACCPSVGVIQNAPWLGDGRLSSASRAWIVSYMIYAHMDCEMKFRDTIFLAVSILDRYVPCLPQKGAGTIVLSQSKVCCGNTHDIWYKKNRFFSHNTTGVEHELKLMGLVCLSLAAKHEERRRPDVPKLVRRWQRWMKKEWTKSEIAQQERAVLTTIGFQLTVPTLLPFLRRFLHVDPKTLPFCANI